MIGKSILAMLVLLIATIFLVGCVEKELTREDEQTLEAELEKLSEKELNQVIEEGESEESKALAGLAYTKIKVGGYNFKPTSVLKQAYKIKARNHEPLLQQGLFKEYLSQETAQEQLIKKTKTDLPLFHAEKYGKFGVAKIRTCSFDTAAELMASCPTYEEVKQTRDDFNIWFESELEEKGVLRPWQCTEGGSESSLMLSVYNTFRLMKCIPFDSNLPWDPEYNNLYEWAKSRNLTQINYFFAIDGEYNHAVENSVYMIGNFLDDPIYRHPIHNPTGVGLVNHLGTLFHEIRHAEVPISHNCGTNDTNIQYGGAWAVHFQLMSHLAYHTGTFFSEYEQDRIKYVAELIRNTRFCDQ